MTRHTLVTGFPGFIGRRLVDTLVADQPDLRITALVERGAEPVARRLAEAHGGRVEVVVGDISAAQLGLDGETWSGLAESLTAVHHLAAIYNLAVPAELAVRVNVDGTGNVLDLCAAAPNFERLVYVSTAYVAGLRTGTVYEHELIYGQAFKNHYEQTKFQAEIWVRDRMGEIPTTILRPAIVVGDSRSGETEKFDGPYYLLRMISLAAARGRQAPQLGRAEVPFNVVPVDFVVRALAAATNDPAMIGETLHLVDPDPLSAYDLLQALSAEYAGKGTSGRLPAGAVATALRLGFVRRMFAETPSESIAYLNHPVRFDTRRARALLAPHDLVPPGFGDYVAAMVAFFRAHEDDPAYAPAA